jgi:hypothetical protein
MVGETEFLGFLVERAPGDRVVVKVFSRDGHLPMIVRVASTWADLVALGTEYDVPQERWSVDEDAQAVLDATNAPRPEA